MEKEKSAVDYLFEELVTSQKNEFSLDELEFVYDKAKAIERHNITNAYLKGYLEEIPNPSPSHYYEDMAEEYYNETFKSE